MTYLDTNRLESALRLIAAAALFALIAAPVSAGNVGGTEHVRASLLVETAGLKPGSTVMAAVRLEMRPGWHSYWLNPGDSGMESTIEWSLPDGVSAGAIQWPTPERIPVGPLVNYGYGRDAVLLTPLTVDATASIGGTVSIVAKTAWLACADVCIPEEATLSLNLPMSASPAVASDSALIAAARAALPLPSPWPASVTRGKTDFQLSVAAPTLDPKLLSDVHFFALQNGAVQAAAPQALSVTPQGLALTLTIGDLPPAAGGPLEGVLALTEQVGDRNVRHAFLVSAIPSPIAPSTGMGEAAKLEVPAIGLAAALLFAFAGGLILNLMPCVLPILAMKAMSFARQGRARAQGLGYGAGVMVSFLAIAGALLILRASGAQIGWGFQLQSPTVVAALACLTFAVGISFSGVTTIGAGLAGAGGGLAARGGVAGSFFTGVLAVLVATPCTAPFMGAALGYALTQPPVEAFAVFLALGAGMAAPFVLVSFLPGTARWLPKPGAWMDRLKQFLAFPMYLTAAWLVWVLSLQAGSDATLAVLLAMVALAFAAWCHHAAAMSDGRWRVFGRSLAVMGLAGAIYLIQGLPSGVESNGSTASAVRLEGPMALKVGAVTWDLYTPEKLAAARAADRPVLLNVTAAWCITCLVNEKVALSSPRVGEALAGSGVVALKADWTRRDAGITALLAEFGRNGVPLYAFYPGHGRPSELLPQILTEAEVIAAIARLALARQAPGI